MSAFQSLQLATAILAAEPDADVPTEPSLLVPGLLLVAFMLVGIAAVWGGLYVAMRWRRGVVVAGERQRLIDRLAAVHRLSADDVRQLKSIAAGLSLTDATLLLIDPRLLEAHAVRYPALADWTVPMGQRLFGTAFVVPHQSEA
ncbi:MAG TPA: hypothetical protein VM165_12735 [Planctomycetaceae bacterium]|nr:hypothetical protein [Planctomycetaceae bacterium]